MRGGRAAGTGAPEAAKGGGQRVGQQRRQVVGEQLRQLRCGGPLGAAQLQRQLHALARQVVPVLRGAAPRGHSQDRSTHRSVSCRRLISATPPSPVHCAKQTSRRRTSRAGAGPASADPHWLRAPPAPPWASHACLGRRRHRPPVSCPVPASSAPACRPTAGTRRRRW